jgi:hypothetical protein
VEGACGEGRRAARTAASGDGPPVQGAGRGCRVAGAGGRGAGGTPPGTRAVAGRGARGGKSAVASGGGGEHAVKTAPVERRDRGAR